MPVTRQMIEAARRAEYDYYRREQLIGSERFIPTPDAVIQAMLEAAFPDTPADVAVAKKVPRIVMARRPKPKR